MTEFGLPSDGPPPQTIVHGNVLALRLSDRTEWESGWAACLAERNDEIAAAYNRGKMAARDGGPAWATVWVIAFVELIVGVLIGIGVS